MTDQQTIFNDEEIIIARAQALLSRQGETLPAGDYAELLDKYKKLYRQSIRLVRMGDRMQNQLNRLYDQLTESEEKYRSIFERSIQGIFRCTASGRFLDLNPAMAKMFGYGSAEEMIRGVKDIFEEIFLSQAQYHRFVLAVQQAGSLKNYIMRLRHRDGDVIWVEVCASGIFDDEGNLVEVEGLAADVTERRRMLEDLKKMARVDGLTGLWNRRYFVELGQREVARAKRDGSPLALMYFDLDNFKRINDTYGHQAGDQALKEAAAIGLDQLRELDIFGRMGGDEFAVLLPGTTEESAVGVAERIRASFENHAVLLCQTKVYFSASFGVVQFCPETPCISISNLIKQADQALYISKREGRNMVSCLAPEHFSDPVDFIAARKRGTAATKI